VVRPNEHQIPNIYRLAKKIGVDEVKLKTAQIYDYQNGNPLIPSNEKYSRYKKNTDGGYSFKYKISDQCWKQWHSSVITWDGKVLPCCFDKDAKHQLGDIKDNTFKEIWVGKAYNAFRKQLLLGRKQIDICSNCSEGCKVWA
jgi:radical SAM protein with 4Fe4S-binding SPASM domain